VNIYSTKPVKIPEPLLIVLYNGKESFPYPDDIGVMKLSDAFISNEYGAVEMNVRIININKGHNNSLHEHCAALKGFSELVGKVNENLKSGMSLDKALKDAIEYCINNGFIRDFLESHATEVRNMLYTEFDLTKALQAAREDAWDEAREEGREEGRVEGRQEGRVETARNMLSDNFPIPVISKITGLSEDIIIQLQM
jgi:predicted transposase/invertase (TIGR01784 family)